MPTGIPRSSVHGTNSCYSSGCRCEACRAANRCYRLENSVVLKHRAKLHRQKRLKLMLELKSVPCTDCGDTYPPYCMDFDHRDPAQKSFVISSQQTCSEKLFLAEVAKCDIICANCHRIRTHKDTAYDFVSAEGCD